MGSKEEEPDVALHRYRNPRGGEFDVLTVSQAQVEVDDRLSRGTIENTFFPQYLWRISTCARCKAHLGWSFRHHEVETCYDDIRKKTKNENQKEHQNDTSATLDRDTIQAIVHSALDRMCLFLKKGYWTFQLCYEDMVEQFHEVGWCSI